MAQYLVEAIVIGNGSFRFVTETVEVQDEEFLGREIKDAMRKMHGASTIESFKKIEPTE